MSQGTKVLPHFEVDKQGLANLYARKGKSYVVMELLQNAWDEEGVTQVDVMLEPLDGGRVRLVVEDDAPEGFADLTHAYRLFAESRKGSQPDKRGRFNLGEKLVIAICEEAKIVTTKGTVAFGPAGRVHSAKSRKVGSLFEGVIAMSEAEVDEVEAAVNTLLVPADKCTTFNLKEVPPRVAVAEFVTALRTEIADADNRLKPTTRKTTVELFEPLAGEVATVYEMGIPVVEIEGDRYHVNVGQKVPVPLDRDNLPPAFVRALRVAVLNHVHASMTPDDAKAEWVTNALEAPTVIAAAAQSAFVGKFGDKTVTFDPNDPEANKRAVAAGYNVVPGGALPKAAWANVKGHGIVLPAGQVTPSPSAQMNAAKKEAPLMDEAHWPAYVRNVAEFAKDFGRELIGKEIQVKVVNAPTAGWGACFEYRGTELTFNLGSLGHKWFQKPDAQKVMDLLFDEFAHHYADDHLDERYYKALRTLGAKAVMLAFDKPGVFDRIGAREGVIA